MNVPNSSGRLMAGVGAFIFLAAPLVMAQPGTMVTNVTVPIPAPMGVGVGIAVDCETPPTLYYTNAFQAHLYKMDWQGNDLGSVPTTDATTGAPISFGAIAWDNFRKVIWAGTDDSGIPVKVYSVDPGTGVATYAFTAHTPGCCGFCDGIDYDLGRDSVYVSDDVSDEIDEHSAATGAWIRTLTPTNAGGETLGLISGVLVGKGDVLYLGQNGLGEIVQVRKSDGSFIGSFAAPGGRNADLACDMGSFATLTAIWSKDAYNDTVTAIQVESGTCECEVPFEPIPAVSTWGLLVMAMLLLTGSKIRFGLWRTVKTPI